MNPWTWALAAFLCVAFVLSRRLLFLRVRVRAWEARDGLLALYQQRKELAQVWVDMCEDKGLLPMHLPAVKNGLAALLPWPNSTDPSLTTAALARRRLELERNLSQLIRASFLYFFDEQGNLTSDAPFFTHYHQLLISREVEIENAQDSYNQAAQRFNKTLSGPVGAWMAKRAQMAPLPLLQVVEGPLPAKKRLGTASPMPPPPMPL